MSGTGRLFVLTLDTHDHRQISYRFIFRHDPPSYPSYYFGKFILAQTLRASDRVAVCCPPGPQAKLILTTTHITGYYISRHSNSLLAKSKSSLFEILLHSSKEVAGICYCTILRRGAYICHVHRLAMPVKSVSLWFICQSLIFDGTRVLFTLTSTYFHCSRL